jgi:single-strand DNA-binding protein
MPDLRMPDINKVYLAGRLTRDPELRYLPSGLAVCKLSLAVSRFYKDKNGERKEDTLFVDVSAWDKMAEYMGQRFRQGNPVLVEGRLKSDSWEDKNTGQKRTKLEVRADRVQELAWPADRPADRSAASAAPASANDANRQIQSDEPIPEDDIPF